MQTEHNQQVQKLFLEIMLQNPESFLRVQNIFNAENFDRELKAVAKFMAEHTDKYKTLPDYKQIQAVTGLELQPVPELNEGHTEWFMAEFENFTRKQELSRAILKSADLLEKGNYDPVEKLIKDAVQISLTKDLGTDYFEDPRARLNRLKSNNGQISTGWPSIDKRLFGGMNRGELNIFAGGSGSGKSLFMQNLALNWVLTGLHGVYLSLELSEDLCAMRLDSMVTSIPGREIFRDLDTVEMKVKIVSKKAGNLWIKYMPAQSNVNHFRAYIKELQVQHNIKPDFICVDYLDLIMPVSAKVSPNDLFVKDKYVSEELRNLAKELNVLLVTASQLNRSAVEEVEFDHSHISGGISKINTADNVFGIFTSRAMKERGRYQLQLMKTRSSSGVGSKIDLEFNQESLRIIDTEQEGEAGYRPAPSQSATILDQIKNKPQTDSPAEVGKVQAEVTSSKLKSMLASLRQGNNS